MQPSKNELIRFTEGFSKSRKGLNVKTVKTFLLSLEENNTRQEEIKKSDKKQLQKVVKNYLIALGVSFEKKETKKKKQNNSTVQKQEENKQKSKNGQSSQSGETKLISVKVKNLRKLGYDNFKEWVSDPDNVYIGRHNHYVGASSSVWRNRFSVKKYGREGCIEKYRDWISEQSELLEQLENLRGKTLGCWCKPESCHGDVLLELLEQNNN